MLLLALTIRDTRTIHPDGDESPTEPLPAIPHATQLLTILACCLATATAPHPHAYAAFSATTSAPANTWAASTLTAPTGLTLGTPTCTGLSQAQVPVSWTAVAGATSYTVRMDYTSLFTNLTTTTTTGTSTTLTATSVATQTTIYVQVRAENGSWRSPYSTTVSGTVGPCTLGGTEPVIQTLTAAADTVINQAAPTQHNGKAANLFVQSASPTRSPGGSGNRRSLLRFDLPAVPTGCTVTAATLSLYNQTPKPDRVIEVVAAATPWNEDTVNWNTQPATTGIAATSTTVADAGIQTWTVTSLVQAWYRGSNNGFILRDRTETAAGSPNQIYRSREAANPLRLVITFC